MSIANPAQYRAARSLLSISQQEIALALGLSLSTVRRCESENVAPVSWSILYAYRAYLEKQGVTFIEQTKDHGPGVMLTEPIANLK